MEHQTNHTQAMDIELLKRDVKSLTELCTKFDNTIDSLQGIAADLSTMVKLQEQRLVIQEKVTDNLEDSLKNSRKEIQQEAKELRIEVKESREQMMENRTFMSERVTEVETNLLDKIDQKLQSFSAKYDEGKKSLAERIAQIESWKWMVMGAGLLLSYVGTRLIDWAKLLKFVLENLAQ